MNKSLSRAIAVSAVSAAGLAGALAVTPTATAETAPRAAASASGSNLTDTGRLQKTGFGYKADVFGTKLLVDGVEFRGLKDGYAQQRCTTMAGREVTKDSLVSIPEEIVPGGLIDLSLTEQSSQTYQHAGRTGVRGISTIGEVEVGGEVPGLGELPRIKVEGLQSVADAYNEGGKYGHQESFDFKGLTIDLTQDNPVSETLEVLFDTVGVSDTVDTVNVTVDQLVTSLVTIAQENLGDTIVIPGLGEIGLGATSGMATGTQAVSEAYALKILVNATGKDTMLQLGRARTRLSEAGPAGVFRGTATGANLLGDAPLVNLGNLGQRSIPCEGTDGKVITQKSGDFTLGAGLVDVTGVTYKYMGKHLQRGAAKAMIGTKVASAAVPSLELEIKGLTSVVKLRRTAKSAEVTPVIRTEFAQVLHKGEVINLRKGESHDLGDGNFISYMVPKVNVFDRTYHGVGVHGLAVTLAGVGVLDLATSAGRIFPR